MSLNILSTLFFNSCRIEIFAFLSGNFSVFQFINFFCGNICCRDIVVILAIVDDDDRTWRRVSMPKESDRVGVGRNAVKLSFTILAAALSLGVSRASSHRSKTDNRSGYSGAVVLFSATTPSVAGGLKELSAFPSRSSPQQLTDLFSRFCAASW